MYDDLKNNKIIMYGTKTCPMVPPVKGIFRRAQVEYEYVDIGNDDAGKAFVRSVNYGSESVPTIVFPDGFILSEPSSREVEEKLQKMGYQPKAPKPWDILRENPVYTLLGVAGLLFGVIDSNQTFIGIGIGLLVLTFIMSSARR